jgi:hypothetical protein
VTMGSRWKGSPGSTHGVLVKGNEFHNPSSRIDTGQVMINGQRSEFLMKDLDDVDTIVTIGG